MAKVKNETSTVKVSKETASATSHYDKIVQECNRLAKLNPTYVWGGGHAGFEYNPTGLDCSGAVSLVLHLAGYDIMPEGSGELMNWGEPGPGKVTIWASTSHVFLMFENATWAWSCPTCHNGWQSLDNYGDPSHPTTDGPYVARHPADLSGPAGHVETGGSGLEGETEIGGTNINVTGTAKAASISTFLNLPGVEENLESTALKGTKSLMNDQHLMPWIEQMAQASLRNYMSMPNGDFYAFIPDYFGGLTNRQAYWDISDAEVIEGMIYLSDDALATHVYVVGDNNNTKSIDFIDKIQSAGVVNVFNAFKADFITGFNAPKVTESKGSKRETETYEKTVAKLPSLADKEKAIDFLKRYGARPYYEEAPMIRSPYFEMFLAYQKFMLLWSAQFEAKFEFTWMPELFPGGIVRFADYGIQMYIQEVSHSGSYESGFTTRATLTAPSSLNHKGRAAVESGMVRSRLF